MTFSLAIVGRPNVGKSTLFNRLIGKRLALVSDRPGVTRDFREGEARLGDISFAAIDTAGIGGVDTDGLTARMHRMTRLAVEKCDVCLLLVDARTGILPLDRSLADLVRRSDTPVILGANKAEGKAGDDGMLEAYELGLGEPLRLSAEHGEGMGELYAALRSFEDAFEDAIGQEVASGESGTSPTEDAPGSKAARPLRIAIVGRPNAGKSSLINRILGEERLLTGEEAGITRDSISVSLSWYDSFVRLYDTAGMRKRARINDELERLSVADGLRSVRFAETVVLLLDATLPLESQDMRIADHAEKEGRAFVVAANKWDLVRAPARRLRMLRDEFEESLPQLRGAPVIPVSALRGHGLKNLHDAILLAGRKWNLRIATGPLNRWLQDMVSAHPPPAPGGRRLRLRYMTQVNARPPTFALMCSKPRYLPVSYTRYLVNGLRRDFGLTGTPVRINLRSHADRNPYARAVKRRR